MNEILDSEIKNLELLVQRSKKMQFYKVEAKKNIISIYCADKTVNGFIPTMKKYLPKNEWEERLKNIADISYEEILQFKLTDKKERLYVIRQYITMTDENNVYKSMWDSVGKPEILKELADRYLDRIEDGRFIPITPDWALPMS